MRFDIRSKLDIMVHEDWKAERGFEYPYPDVDGLDTSSRGADEHDSGSIREHALGSGCGYSFNYGDWKGNGFGDGTYEGDGEGDGFGDGDFGNMQGGGTGCHSLRPRALIPGEPDSPGEV